MTFDERSVVHRVYCSTQTIYCALGVGPVPHDTFAQRNHDTQKRRKKMEPRHTKKRTTRVFLNGRHTFKKRRHTFKKRRHTFKKETTTHVLKKGTTTHVLKKNHDTKKRNYDTQKEPRHTLKPLSRGMFCHTAGFADRSFYFRESSQEFLGTKTSYRIHGRFD
jgi:hypothetical protein